MTDFHPCLQIISERLRHPVLQSARDYPIGQVSHQRVDRCLQTAPQSTEDWQAVRKFPLPLPKLVTCLLC